MNSDIAYEVAKYLANAGFGVMGTSMFAGQIPEDTVGIWVERSSGTLDNYVPIENSVVDVYIKSASSQDAISSLESIKRYIHRMHNTSIDHTYIYSFLVIGDVEDVQRDNEYAKVYKISLQVMHRDTYVIS